MQQKNIRLMISALLTIIFIAACSPVSIPPTQETQVVGTSAPQATIAETATEPSLTPAVTESSSQGLCANMYYPVREGATWIYKSTGGPAGEYSFSDTITSVRADGFTLSTKIGDLTRTQEWTCSSEGLAALQLGGAPAAMLNSQNIQLNLDVKNATGVTFPVQINPGDQWQQNLDVEGNVNAFNEEAKATGSAQMKFSAVDNESVTVPAGTFNALKVNVDVTLDIKATYQGINLPVEFTGAYTYWFAPDVGWVKSNGTGTVLGNSFSETTELQSYNIP